jgi:hypothetical protein
MPRVSIPLLCAALLIASAVVRAQSSAVRVTREPPVVTRTEVDPLHRRPDEPIFGPYESGVCNATFEIQTSVGYSVEIARQSLRLHPTSIEVVTRLKLDIFTLAGGPPTLLAHEEAHRAISEHYYDDAAAVARKLGATLIGKSFAGTGKTRAAAEKNAFDKAVKGYNEAYFERIRARAAAANVRFDEITDHGRSAITAAEARELALASDP